MKVGDIFVAKRNFRNFKKNKGYKIKYICSLLKVTNATEIPLITFQADDTSFFESDLNEYFYTEQELRKIKLNKINENR